MLILFSELPVEISKHIESYRKAECKRTREDSLRREMEERYKSSYFEEHKKKNEFLIELEDRIFISWLMNHTCSKSLNFVMSM